MEVGLVAPVGWADLWSRDGAAAEDREVTVGEGPVVVPIDISGGCGLVAGSVADGLPALEVVFVVLGVGKEVGGGGVDGVITNYECIRAGLASLRAARYDGRKARAGLEDSRPDKERVFDAWNNRPAVTVVACVLDIHGSRA